MLARSHRTNQGPANPLGDPADPLVGPPDDPADPLGGPTDPLVGPSDDPADPLGGATKRGSPGAGRTDEAARDRKWGTERRRMEGLRWYLAWLLRSGHDQKWRRGILVGQAPGKNRCVKQWCCRPLQVRCV
eukprot:772811-Prorocentrum_minimum.AAC.2